MRFDILKNDIKKIPFVALVFAFMALGLVMMRESQFGLDPWGVFHEGIANYTSISFGKIIVYVGYALLVFSIVLKIYPGIGTVLNILLIGTFVDVIESSNLFTLTVTGDNLLVRVVYFLIGIFLFNFGKALYISVNIGAGPRDGLFVGLVRITKIDVKYIKSSVEGIVLIVGIVLGGIFGLGTIIQILLSSYIVDLSFKIIKYDPKTRVPRALHHYIKKA